MNYHDIKHDDMTNGDGLRVTLFVSGCEHRCRGCQNPQTWDHTSGIRFDNDALNELISELDKDYISGLTISGGDPLNSANIEMVFHLVVLLKGMFPNKTIWIYTGYVWEDLISSIADKEQNACYMLSHILDNIDILVDGPYVEELNDEGYPWAGSTNQRVIDVKKSLKGGEVILHEVHR